MCRADIALIGLAVMGQNLILNMNDHNFVVSSRYLKFEMVSSFVDRYVLILMSEIVNVIWSYILITGPELEIELIVCYGMLK